MRGLRMIQSGFAPSLLLATAGWLVGCASHDDQPSQSKGNGGSSGTGVLPIAGAVQVGVASSANRGDSGGASSLSSAARANSNAGSASAPGTNSGSLATGGNLSVTYTENGGNASITVGGSVVLASGGSTASANSGGNQNGGKGGAGAGGKGSVSTGGKGGLSLGGKANTGGKTSTGGRVGAGGRPNLGGTAGAAVVPIAGSSGTAIPCATYVTKPTVTGALFEGATGISGIVASRKQPGVFWIHSDRQKNLFAIDASGTLLGTWEITSTARFFYLYNWEDISIQSIAGGPDRIWIGDIGNNCIRPETGCESEPRTEIRILSIDEPTVAGDAPITGTAPVIDDLKFTYPDGLHDAEGMAVEPATGDLYVISKEQESPSKIYRATAPLAGGEMNYVGSFDAKNINAADFSPSGRELVIRDYVYLYYWALPAGKTWREVFSGELTPPTKRTMLTYTENYYSEAIAFAPDESGLYVVSEEKEGSAPSPV